jgi:hypothetical protein
MSICSTKIKFYTIELVFKVFIYPSSSHGKLIDFNNRLKDSGFYIYYGPSKTGYGAFLQFSPGGGTGEDSLYLDRYNQVVITRDLSEKVTVYLNKTKQFEFYDYDKNAVIFTENLFFFKDDEVTDTEEYKYVVSKININPSILSESEIMNLDIFHGITNNCPTGTPEPTETPLPTPTPEVCVASFSDIPNEIYIYKNCEDLVDFVCTQPTLTSPPPTPTATLPTLTPTATFSTPFPTLDTH